MMAISPESKMRTPDRVLTLELIDGKNPRSSGGLIDPRLFSKEGDTNRLHAVMDPATCLWTMKYEKGAIPEVLKGQFTGFKQLKKFAEDYFVKRNIRISEVRD